MYTKSAVAMILLLKTYQKMMLPLILPCSLKIFEMCLHFCMLGQILRKSEKKYPFLPFSLKNAGQHFC